ncbi:type II secretion system protein E [Chthoniobacter flavus Ellin428]|uniref:Type II secretion system protein E n=1 Tax=Chthoniobacter flavus Ellin428 TaxID=497964 RepID=B4CVB5_9BACT|nr:ATPase, T2SS/T4P/T4SS family [Chthoniobacter flavus]EDY21357.1 type II secretion system protein E [Chthoniobacter flavus Ellin428]TCO95321.1 type IV pilus assembly protein PilB [Chthoniobacter flavus]
MSIKSFGERIADVLIEDGLLLPSQLAEAMDLQKKQGGRLLKLLTDKQYVTEQDMVISMGRCLDVPPINLSKVRVPENVQELVPKDMARMYKLAPVCKLGNKLFVAMADPLNVLALDDLRQRTKLEIVPMITTERSVTEALSGVGSAGSQMDQVLKEAANQAQAEANVEEVKQKREEIDLDRLAVESEDAPVVKIVNLILVQALKEKASDIHIEPFEKQLKLRYRVDGALVEASSPPKALQLPIASRIKILAGLDIAERRLPQDGRFRIRVSGKEVDLRISVLPTTYGEKIVIRLLDKGALSGSIDQLGMDEYTLGIFRKAVDAPHGMILVTGPTGSGKTTTLYSVLSELNNPEYNIVTVEDPIEYQLSGINQVAVKADIGLSFADALRSILRQDPDIVMIGEIRDNETADIAVKAALTGHQVLSTLHTNDAAGAISRLDDMGIEPFLISSSVLLTCAQRLVRRVCPNCREEFQPEPELLAKLEIQDDNTTFYQGAGCDRCKRRGYVGRAAIIEVLPVSETIRRLIIKRASAAVIKNQAVSEGMKTLRMVGIDKAREGVTTLEEILRVTAEDH